MLAVFRDSHLLVNDRLATYIRRNSKPSDSVLSLTQNDPVVYWLSGRRPATPYLWSSNVNHLTAARGAILRAIAEQRPQVIVLRTAAAVSVPYERNYKVATRIGSDVLLLPKPWAAPSCPCRFALRERLSRESSRCVVQVPGTSSGGATFTQTDGSHVG